MAGNALYQGKSSEGNRAGDFLHWEEDGQYSRALAKVVGAKTIPCGTVVLGVLGTSVAAWDGSATLTAGQVGIITRDIVVPAGETMHVSVIDKMAVLDARKVLISTGAALSGAQQATLIAAMPTILFRVQG